MFGRLKAVERQAEPNGYRWAGKELCATTLIPVNYSWGNMIRGNWEHGCQLKQGEFNMQTSLLVIGIILTLASHWEHHRMLDQLRQRHGQLTGQVARNRVIYHGLLYLGLLYVIVGLWQPAWLNARVIGLLLAVDLLAVIVGWHQRRHRQYPAALRRLWQRQAWYLTSSQLLLGAVLLGTLLGITDR